MLQAAETAYTVGDVVLSIKIFLMVADMTDGDDSESLVESTPLGITVRAWYGVKLVGTLACYFRTESNVELMKCTRRIAQDARLATSSPSDTPLPSNVEVLDELQQSVYGSRTPALGKRGRLQRGEKRCLPGLLPLDPIFGRKLYGKVSDHQC
jgi:hypothetical protein